MKRLLGAALLSLVWSAAEAGRSESEIQEVLCRGMALEQRLASGGRVDCLDGTFAIEIDFSEKWHQAIGQSLYYASQTGRAAAIVLVCRKSERVCLGHSLRLQSTIAEFGLPITVFECGEYARTIERDCLKRQPQF